MHKTVFQHLELSAAKALIQAATSLAWEMVPDPPSRPTGSAP